MSPRPRFQPNTNVAAARSRGTRSDAVEGGAAHAIGNARDKRFTLNRPRVRSLMTICVDWRPARPKGERGTMRSKEQRL